MTPTEDHFDQFIALLAAILATAALIGAAAGWNFGALP